MDIKEFYNQIGGSYEDAISRLMNDFLIEKFVYRFKETTSLDALKKAIKEKDYEKAFLEIHTLKGVVLNLGFQKLGIITSEYTELLRGDNKRSVDEFTLTKYTESLEKEFNNVISLII